MTVLEQLPLARLRFELTALEEAELPAFKGDLLRMALLWWLSEYWCAMPDRCRHGCRRPETCLFGRLIEPAMDPTWPLAMQRLIGDTPPPAYALWDQQDRRGQMAGGEGWGFELTLAGELALRQTPAIVAAVMEGAERGMGRERVRSRLRRVTALVQDGTGPSERCLAAEKPAGDNVTLTWENYRLADIAYGWAQATAWTGGFSRPVRGFSLRYLSPMKIKEHDRWVEVPVFGAVMRAVVRRLRLLSLVHGGGEWPHEEWGPLLDLAETVPLEHDETRMIRYTRHSARSGTQEVEGFVGQAWYGGDDLRPLLPPLWLCQWLQIGKAYVLGAGRYQIEQVVS